MQAILENPFIFAKNSIHDVNKVHLGIPGNDRREAG